MKILCLVIVIIGTTWAVSVFADAPASTSAPPAATTAPAPSEESVQELEARLIAQLRLLSALYLDNDQPDKALDCLKKIAALTPDDTQPLRELAVRALWFERYDYALPAFEKLLQSRPDDLTCLYGLAVCYKAKGDKAKSEEFLKKARSAAPDDASAHLEAADCFGSIGLMDIAYAELDKVIAMPRNNNPRADAESAIAARITAMDRKARCLFFEGRYAEAARLLKQTKDEAEANGWGSQIRMETYTRFLTDCEARQFAQEGKLPQAQEKFEEALRLMPEDPEIAARLYLCLKAQGKNDEAQKVFAAEEAKLAADVKAASDKAEAAGGEQTNPSASPYNAMAWFYAVADEKIDDGIKLVEKALAAWPKSGPILDTAAELYYAKAGTLKDDAKKAEALATALKYSRSAYRRAFNDSQIPYYLRQIAKMQRPSTRCRRTRGNPPTPRLDIGQIYDGSLSKTPFILHGASHLDCVWRAAGQPCRRTARDSGNTRNARCVRRSRRIRPGHGGAPHRATAPAQRALRRQRPAGEGAGLPQENRCAAAGRHRRFG